jgi:hypothetical protein
LIKPEVEKTGSAGQQPMEIDIMTQNMRQIVCACFAGLLTPFEAIFKNGLKVLKHFLNYSFLFFHTILIFEKNMNA